VRFSCERCGKKYATAEDPAPGRVYKLKCKACGHLMVVKASAAPAAVEPPSGRVEVATPEPSRGAASGNGDGPPSFEATTEVSTAAMRGQAEQEPTPPPGDAGYVDLFSDIASGSSEAPAEGERRPVPRRRARVAPRDVRQRSVGRAGSVSRVPRRPRAASAAAPQVPVIPKPNQGKTPIPLALIGAGVAVLVGIFAFAMLSPGMRAAPSASAPAAVATPSAPATPAPAPPETARAQPAIPVPPPHAAPEKADPRAEQKRKEREEAQARADQVRAERGARERARAERDAAAKAERDAKEQAAVEKPLAEPEGGLTQAQIEGVLRSTKPAFDGCIQAARAGDVTLDGRRVVLRLNIQTSGTVTSPTLDDAAMNGTEPRLVPPERRAPHGVPELQGRHHARGGAAGDAVAAPLGAGRSGRREEDGPRAGARGRREPRGERCGAGYTSPCATIAFATLMKPAVLAPTT